MPAGVFPFSVKGAQNNRARPFRNRQYGTPAFADYRACQSYLHKK